MVWTLHRLYCRVTHGQVFLCCSDFKWNQISCFTTLISESAIPKNVAKLGFRLARAKVDWILQKRRFSFVIFLSFFCHFSVIFSEIIPFYRIVPKMYNFVKECLIILALLRALLIQKPFLSRQGYAFLKKKKRFYSAVWKKSFISALARSECASFKTD